MRVGDVVRLKSGGPAMTVEEVATTGVVSVAWVDEENGSFRDRFPEAMLFVEVWPPSSDVPGSPD